MIKKLQGVSVQDQTWIVSDHGVRLGMLSVQPDQTWLWLAKGAHLKFEHISELEKLLGGKIIWEKAQKTDAKSTQTLVHNLPIKHDQALDVQTQPWISYRKNAQSDLRFAAGYWILKFSTGWSGSLSPKCTTLQEYEHQGPFQTKLEMNTILAQRNQEFKKI